MLKSIGVLKKIRNVRRNVHLEYKEGNLVLHSLNNLSGVAVESHDHVKIIPTESLCNKDLPDFQMSVRGTSLTWQTFVSCRRNFVGVEVQTERNQ